MPASPGRSRGRRAPGPRCVAHRPRSRTCSCSGGMSSIRSGSLMSQAWWRTWSSGSTSSRTKASAQSSSSWNAGSMSKSMVSLSRGRVRRDAAATAAARRRRRGARTRPPSAGRPRASGRPGSWPTSRASGWSSSSTSTTVYGAGIGRVHLVGDDRPRVEAAGAGDDLPPRVPARRTGSSRQPACAARHRSRCTSGSPARPGRRRRRSRRCRGRRRPGSAGAATSSVTPRSAAAGRCPGGSGVHVTRHTSAPSTWFDDVPRICRTPSTMWFMPWM